MGVCESYTSPTNGVEPNRRSGCLPSHLSTAIDPQPVAEPLGSNWHKNPIIEGVTVVVGHTANSSCIVFYGLNKTNSYFACTCTWSISLKQKKKQEQKS